MAGNCLNMFLRWFLVKSFGDNCRTNAPRLEVYIYLVILDSGTWDHGCEPLSMNTYLCNYVFIFTPYIFLFFMLRGYVYCHVIHAAMLTCVPTCVPTLIIDCCLLSIDVFEIVKNTYLYNYVFIFTPYVFPFFFFTRGRVYCHVIQGRWISAAKKSKICRRSY